jgi:hypothetical protein
MPVYLLPDDGSSIIVQFDLTLSEGHEATAEVTDHPVETGSNVADHIRANPPSLNLELYVTQTPINDLGGRGSINTYELTIPKYEAPLAPTPGALFRLAGDAIGAVVDAITGGPVPIRAQVLSFPEPFDRVKETHTTLLDLLKRGVTSSVVTSTLTYDLMALTSVSLPITEPGGGSFGLAMKQIRTVTTGTTKAPKPAEKRGAPGQAKGGQASKPVGGKDAVKASSAAVKALQGLGILP